VITRVLIVAAILFAQFWIFEAALRWHAGLEAAPGFQSLFMPDPVAGYRMRPGAGTRFTTAEFSTDIRINNAGVRGPDFGAKADNERRVLVLGDSMVLSVQVAEADTFCQRLEDRLNQSRGPVRYRVINGGVQGYGPVEMALSIDRTLSELEPDLIIIGAYAANDATEAADSAPRLDGPAPAPLDAGELQRSTRRVLRRSMVLQVARMRVMQALDRLGRAPVPQRPLVAYLTDPPADVPFGLSVSARAFGRIADAAAAKRVPTAIVLIPARFQVDDDDYGRLAEIVRASGGTLARDAGTERMAAALAPLHLPTLNLLPILRASPDPVGLYFRQNAHFTPRGHEVIAAALEPFVRAHGLLSDPSGGQGRLRPDDGASAPGTKGPGD
jgi:lysophospholipase L1-like esterase